MVCCCKFAAGFTELVLIQKACSILVGHHDFSSFRAAGCQVILSFLTMVNSFYYMS
jgi:tRNA U38,U39,U40 pseudouridine synthase TruA